MKRKYIRIPNRFSGNRQLYLGKRGGVFFVKNGKKRYMSTQTLAEREYPEE